jgi:hypothetical protein
MPTAAVFMGAGLLELDESELSEEESLEELLVLDDRELVRVVALALPLALLAEPVARPVAVAWAPVREAPAPPVTDAMAPEAPEMRLETWPAAPVAPAPISDVKLLAREPAPPMALEAPPPTTEVASPSALVTWLAAELRAWVAVSMAPLGPTADSTFESAAPRSWAYVGCSLALVLGVASSFAPSGARGLTETAAARPRRIMEDRMLRVVDV